VTLWLDAAEKSPGKARAHLNAGAAYHRAERLDEAVAHYCRALAIVPGDPLARANLELALLMQGKDVPGGEEPAPLADLLTFCP
jgi:Flp pilus assembly protein TadD